MEDIAGLGKIVDSKLVAKIYDDEGSPAIHELGGIAADLIKTMRPEDWPNVRRGNAGQGADSML
jgi:hypothetical protein